jgi:hypothetical protein
MQGIFHTGMSVIRGQMRLAGVLHPMDAGAPIDPDTGGIVLPAEAGEDSRYKRAIPID